VIEPYAGMGRNRLKLTGAYVVCGRGNTEEIKYEAECKCGNITWVRLRNFLDGHTKSCGCLKKEKAALQGKLAKSHGMSKTPEWESYEHAKQRCTNPNNKCWKDYGGRGIKFLFTSFEQFFAELGRRPKGKSLDRMDNNGNYEPGNVRWATKMQQTKNKRS